MQGIAKRSVIITAVTARTLPETGDKSLAFHTVLVHFTSSSDAFFLNYDTNTFFSGVLSRIYLIYYCLFSNVIYNIKWVLELLSRKFKKTIPIKFNKILVKSGLRFLELLNNILTIYSSFLFSLFNAITISCLCILVYKSFVWLRFRRVM